MIKRLLKLPLYMLWLILAMTIIIPIGYWVVTGEDFLDFKYRIDYL
jgi:hypothetical protein